MKSNQSVERFYDLFLESRMVDYRLKGNLRLDLAKKLLLSVVRPADTVADIGCGIGIVTEAIAKANPQSRVVGVDISRANIEYAKATIHRTNVHFVHADVTEQFDHLHEISPDGYDVIALVDVIEHIPETNRLKLFSDLQNIAKSNTLLVLTYPSPEYQKYLISEKPEELQVIDNVIELGELCREASEYGWAVQSFQKVDVWVTNQYVHCVLTRPTEKLNAVPRSRTMITRGNRLLDRVFLRPFRAWYYRDRLLKRRNSGS